MQAREVRFLVGVLAVVTDDRGRILLLRHTYRPFAPWGLPSGVLKADESLEDSMKREIREEAELDVEFEEILRVRASSRPRRVDVWMKYRAAGGTPRPTSAEVEAAQFFDLQNLPDLIVEQQLFLADNRERIIAGRRASGGTSSMSRIES
jgi:ADP-ribose pyrophosphatase YjhB (NUDIX family)